MNIVCFSIAFISFWSSTEALWCWKCINAKSNRECQQQQRKENCFSNQATCFSEVRRGWDGIKIRKGCKQTSACKNNYYQNNRHAWRPTQCNNEVPSSACWCCCSFNGCNVNENCKKQYDCPPIPPPSNGKRKCTIHTSSFDLGTVCRFECNKDFDMVGPSTSTCMIMEADGLPRFNRPAPRCVHKPCQNISAPRHGRMTCTNGFKHGSVCSFQCDDTIEIESDIGLQGKEPLAVPRMIDLIGPPSVRCLAFSRWNSIPPICVAVQCTELTPPANVLMTCTYGTFKGSKCSFFCEEGNKLIGPSSTLCNHQGIDGAVWTNDLPVCIHKRCEGYPSAPNNGSFSCTDGNFLNSVCEFSCDENHWLLGSQSTQCIEEVEYILSWSHNTPTCERITCEDQLLRNGRITCTNGSFADSVCTYECTSEDFELSPLSVTSGTCLENASWNVTKPCCSRVCPPFSVVDVIIMLDSSSSIGQENWNTMKTFVRNLINTFVIGPDAVQLGVFRYNRYVDTTSQILLNDFPDDKEALLQAFDQIPYDGSGTRTGQALRHARNVMLNPRNGNRLDVPDYIIVITDGRSADSISSIAQRLHADETQVFVIGVVPHRGGLDKAQLLQLVTQPNDLVIAEAGFEDLNTDLFKELVEIVCTPGCL